MLPPDRFRMIYAVMLGAIGLVAVFLLLWNFLQPGIPALPFCLWFLLLVLGVTFVVWTL